MTPALSASTAVPALSHLTGSGTRTLASDATLVVAFQTLPTLPGLDTLPNLVVVLAFVLLGGGVVGSVVPVVPSGLLSLSGVLCYWFATGFSDPGLLILSGLVLVSLVAMAAEWLSGAVSAKAGGASTRTTVVATVVGLLGMLVVGPLGFLAGTAGTVFALTYVEREDARESLRAAGITLVGMLTSTILQLVLTVGVLVVMVGVLVF